MTFRSGTNYLKDWSHKIKMNYYNGRRMIICWRPV